jgi:hypothetical protein
MHPHASQPAHAFDRYFVGRMKAWGMFYDRFGTLRRRFVADIDSRWEGAELTLAEDFRFDDGETQRRVWHIRKRDDGTYDGHTGAVIGIARGAPEGDVVHWRYDFLLPLGVSAWRVHFDDRMVFHDDELMVSRARVSKLGIALGELLMVFRRQPAGAAAATTEPYPQAGPEN